MKKSLIVIIVLFFCLILSIIILYANYQSELKQLELYNSRYEVFYQKDVLGTEVATIINRSVDINEKNFIEKDKNGLYIDDGMNTVRIDLKFLDNKDTIYHMETIYNLGVNEFVYNFNLMRFRNTKIEYHESSKKVKYLLFEEIE